MTVNSNSSSNINYSINNNNYNNNVNGLVKGKVHPRTGHEGPEGEKMYTFNLGCRKGGINATPRPL